MRWYAWMLVVLAVTGCKTTDRGFGVELTLTVDPSVSDAQIATIKHLHFNTTGDEMESPTYDFMRAAFSDRREQLVYRPLASSHSITIAVDAVDDNDTVIASGTTGPIDLPASRSAHASVNLTAPTVAADMGTDGGVVRAIAFQSQSTYTAVEPIAVAAADFDGDGKLDVVVASFGNSQNITILKNNGGNSFLPTTLTVGAGLSSVVALDFNMDMKPDLAFAGTGGIYVLINKGDGTFKPAVTYSGPTYVAGGDVTSDGKPDLVGLTTSGVTIYTNNGDGTFVAGTPIPLSNYGAVAVADVSSDGKADIVAYSGTAATTAAVLVNNGSGFNTPVPYGSAAAQGLAVGDVTGDGKADLVFSENGVAGIFVLAGNGNGTFPTTAPNMIASTAASAVLIGDINGDQKLDVIALASKIEVITNLGANSFVTSSESYICNGCGSGVLADFDGDKTLDIAVAAAQTYTIGISHGGGDGTFADGYLVGGDNAIGLSVLGDVSGDKKLDIVGLNTGIGVLKEVDARAFTSIAQLTAGMNTYGLTVADITGDQSLDIVTANGLSNNVSVYSNPGNGTFGSAPLSYSSGGTRVVAVAAIDFTGDGKVDVAAVNQDTANLTAFVNTGSGLMPMGSPIAVGGTNPSAVTGGDLDKDGKVDLVVATGPASVVILHGAGDGTFVARAPLTVGMGIIEARLADLDGDGFLDIVTVNGQDVSVLINDRNGGVQPVVSYPLAMIKGGALTLTDFNLDGKVDVAVVGNGTSSTQPAVWIDVFAGNGDGTLAKPPLVMLTESNAASIAVGDLNGDSLPDIVTGVAVTINSSH